MFFIRRYITLQYVIAPLSVCNYQGSNQTKLKEAQGGWVHIELKSTCRIVGLYGDLLNEEVHSFVCNMHVTYIMCVCVCVCVYVCDQICQKKSYTCTVSTHTFHCHMLTTPRDQQHMCLILLKVDQSAFTQTSFSSLSDVHECSGDLQIAHLTLTRKQLAVFHHTIS